MELKYKFEEIQKKDGTKTEICQFYVELDINGKLVPYVLKLDYSQLEFLQALIVK